jgi:hypothetical protein
VIDSNTSKAVYCVAVIVDSNLFTFYIVVYLSHVVARKVLFDGSSIEDREGD